ncbi:hypothetical protein R1sor_001582 [Riccia sorocarpa]|uniref:Uncharacterized protein n=1 Tax=Riccia sorocarpa TaxID=122646 RepID=A0ABD3GZR3_9MARC
MELDNSVRIDIEFANVQAYEEDGRFQVWICFWDQDKWANRCDNIVSGEGTPAHRNQETQMETPRTEPELGEGYHMYMRHLGVGILPIAGELELEGDQDIREIDLDLNKAASKLGRIRKTVVVLQVLKSSPNHDHVVGWVRESLVLQKGAHVSQVKALTKKEFL